MPFLRRPKIDIVVVAVRYENPETVSWVRAFERRGATWSDRRMIQRTDLIDRILAGEKVVVGKRIEFEAGTFDTGEDLRVEDRNGVSVLMIGAGNGSGDSLKGIPVI